MNVLLLLTWRGALMVLIVMCLDRLLAAQIRARARRVWWLLVPPAFLLTLSVPVLPAHNASLEPVGAVWATGSLSDATLPIRPEAPARAFVPRLASTQVWSLLTTAGGVIYLLTIAARTRSALRRWGREALCTDDALLALLEDCKATAGVTAAIGLVVSERMDAPLIVGWLRPRILLPRALVASSSREQLQGVLFHELAHHRFGDIPCTWLFSLVCALHWFNPAAHFALRGWARFREEAADEAAIGWLGQASGLEYGRTLLHVLRHANDSPPAPGAALAIVESVSQLRKRLTMIKHYERRSTRPLLTGILLVAAAAGILLRPTRAQSPLPADATSLSASAEEKSKGMHPASPPPAADQIASRQALIDLFKADQIASRQALIDLFKKRDYKIPEYLIDERVASILHEEFKDDRAAFLQNLQTQGYTEASFREAEREKIIVQAMRYQLQAEAQEAKARTILLPNVVVTNMNLADAIASLAAKVHELYPEVHGMVPRLDPEAPQALKDTKITLNLHNVSLLEVMQALAQQANGTLGEDSQGPGIRARDPEPRDGKLATGTTPTPAPERKTSSATNGQMPPGTTQATSPLDGKAAAQLASSLANAAAKDQFGVVPFLATNAAPELVQGKWCWRATAGYGHSDLLAVVSFSPSGSEPTMSISQMILPQW